MSEHMAWVGHGAPSVRVRDTYVRDVAGPLLSRGADGVVKLDLVLRGLALLPPRGEPGVVPGDVSWAELHDMCRGGQSHLETETALKQRWVNDKLSELELSGLLHRRPIPGARSHLVVLSDRGDGSAFDDPGAVGDPYVTFLGNLVRFDRIGPWNSSALAAYFAAMNAERYSRADERFARAERLDQAPIGGGRWMRPLGWFNDPRVSHGPGDTIGRPAEHVRFPFNERTLRRGVSQLVKWNFIAVQSSEIDPRTGRPFKSGFSRSIYFNSFHLARAERALRAYHLVQETSASADRRFPISPLGNRLLGTST